MTSPLLTDVTVREATYADKAAVLAINDNIADGRDYLPALYDFYNASPNAKMFVLSLKDKIVAFAGVLFVDDGLTGIGRAARVDPALAGHGLANHLMINCARWAKAKGIIRQAGTEVHKGIISRERRERREKDGDAEILMKIILPYVASVEHLRQTIPPAVTSQLYLVTDVILSEYFASNPIKKYLFPQGRILVNSIPYRPMSTNIPLILDKSGYTEIYSDVVLGNKECTGLLSVGTVYPVKRPKFAYNIEIYGDCTSIKSLETHIARHLTRITEKACGKVSIHVVIDENVSRTTVDKVMLQYDKVRTTTNAEEPKIKRTLYEVVHHLSRI